MSETTKSPLAKIAPLLSPSTIKLDVQARKKEPALREIAELLTGRVANFEAFFAEILERESINNTALGHSVAIPHARTEQCTEILIAVGRSEAGIEFDTKERTPVHLIFLIGTPKQMVTDYLRVVGNLARLLRHPDLIERLRTAPDPAAFIKLIEAAES